MLMRTALVAMLLCLTLFLLRPRHSDASGAEADSGQGPASAALVTPGDRGGSDRGGTSLGAAGLALLVAGGFVPAVFLIARRRSRQSSPE
jgi:hypothetical protein